MEPDLPQRLQELSSSEIISGIDKPETFVDFFKSITAIGNELIATLKKIKSQGKSIHIYGASTKGNIILQFCNLNSKHIPYIAEVNKFKFNRYTPGSKIKIISEYEAKKKSPDYFLVLPWHFKNYIIKKENKYLRRGGKLIFPLPDIDII